MPNLYVVKKDSITIDVRTGTADVAGLNEFVDGKIGGAEAGIVSSISGHTGEVILAASDVKALSDTIVISALPSNAISKKDGLMSKTDRAKLGVLSVFASEKVGEA